MNKSHNPIQSIHTIKSTYTSNSSNILWYQHLGNLSYYKFNFLAKKFPTFPFREK